MNYLCRSLMNPTAGLAGRHRDSDGASRMAAACTARRGSASGGQSRGAGVDRGGDGEGEGGAAVRGGGECGDAR